MNAETEAKRHDDIKRLHQEIESWPSEFLSPSDLQRLGIHALQVDTSDDGSLQLDPCFFQPLRPQLLRDYPICSDSERLAELDLPLDWEGTLRRTRETFPHEKELEKRAAQVFQNVQELYTPEDWWRRARETHDHICSQLNVCRDGLPGDGYPSLRQFETLNGPKWRNTYRRRDQRTFEDGLCAQAWRIPREYEDKAKKHAMPHALFTIIADVRANNYPQSLTRCEMKAIIRVMRVRTAVNPYQRHLIQPALVLSYMGRKHGRIIQAHHDGERMTIQYSPLWSFEDEDTAPVELFVRYNLSIPIGLQKETLCIR